MDKQAIKPSFYNLPTFKADEESKEKEVSDEERRLYSLSKSTGWKVLKEYIGNVRNDLDNFNARAMETGANFEEIGKNTVVINLAKGIIERVLNKVGDAREAIESEEQGGK